jgi:hypothetical protein
MKFRTLDELVDKLHELDCYPGLYKRSGKGDEKWRFHVNVSGNYWADGRTPLSAARKAVKRWMSDGYPMDGAAAIQ